MSTMQYSRGGQDFSHEGRRLKKILEILETEGRTDWKSEKRSTRPQMFFFNGIQRGAKKRSKRPRAA